MANVAVALPPLALALSPRGERLAVADRGDRIALFDVGRERPVHTLPWGARLPMALAFSSDGHTVAALSNDDRRPRGHGAMTIGGGFSSSEQPRAVLGRRIAAGEVMGPRVRWPVPKTVPRGRPAGAVPRWSPRRGRPPPPTIPVPLLRRDVRC